MEHEQFDAMTMALATGASRRRVLTGLLGGTLAGALGRQGTEARKRRRQERGWQGVTAQDADHGNDACAHFCAAVFGVDTPEAGACTSRAAHEQGPCYECGPQATDPTRELCGAACCAPGQECVDGRTCEFPTCPGSGRICDVAFPCGPDGACLCFHTAEGPHVCVANAGSCFDTPTCEASDQCPPGHVCALTCCTEEENAGKGNCFPACGAALTRSPGTAGDRGGRTVVA